MGASMEFAEKAHVGLDIVVPMNDEPGNFSDPVIALGGDIEPFKWVRLSAGFMTGGGYDLRIPLGFTIISKKGSYEMGISSRDMLTFITKNGPTLSMSTGFMRFRF
jgi:hypothetical protein